LHHSLISTLQHIDNLVPKAINLLKTLKRQLCCGIKPGCVVEPAESIECHSPQILLWLVRLTHTAHKVKPKTLIRNLHVNVSDLIVLIGCTILVALVKNAPFHVEACTWKAAPSGSSDMASKEGEEACHSKLSLAVKTWQYSRPVFLVAEVILQS